MDRALVCCVLRVQRDKRMKEDAFYGRTRERRRGEERSGTLMGWALDSQLLLLARGVWDQKGPRRWRWRGPRTALAALWVRSLTSWAALGIGCFGSKTHVDAIEPAFFLFWIDRGDVLGNRVAWYSPGYGVLSLAE